MMFLAGLVAVMPTSSLTQSYGQSWLTAAGITEYTRPTKRKKASRKKKTTRKNKGLDFQIEI